MTGILLRANIPWDQRLSSKLLLISMQMLAVSARINCNGRNNTMAKRIQLHVDGLAAMGNRFGDAWHRAQTVETVDEAHVTFLIDSLAGRCGWPANVEVVPLSHLDKLKSVA